MTLFYDEIYSSGLDRSARFPVDRYSRIAEQVGRDDRDGLIELRRPRTATREEILLVHQCDYVDRFLAQDLEKAKFVELVCVHGSQKLSSGQCVW